jgi:hypothetical protein
MRKGKKNCHVFWLTCGIDIGFCMLKIRVVTIGIRALAWIQGLSWKLMYVEMF